MMPIYCNQGHQNQNGSRFCIQCGEPLWLPTGEVLEKRYRIIRQLATGGFGRTYLAENLHRFNERCVLKEFAPQVQENRELEKAKELFEREAGALYNLTHPQLPKFLEFFQAELNNGANCLFLAQDYIEGETYYDLLKSRGRFSEAEVRQFMCKLLPVLTYIHAQGVVHRDIAPDNIILRSSDQTPVLIDFGGVKQIAATAVSKFTRFGVPTLLGKPGYAPQEQMHHGKVFPNSDLYALAVTALVLLTAKEPQDLYDNYKGIWQWRKEIQLSNAMETVLQKMLAFKPGDRFGKAEEVLHALQASKAQKTPLVNISQLRTINVLGRKPNPQTSNHQPAPILTPQTNTQVVVQPTPSFQPPQLNLNWVRPFLVKATTVSVVGLVATMAWVLASSVMRSPQFNPIAQQPATNTANSAARLKQLVSRRQALQVREAFFIGLVDDSFYRLHPELNGRSLKADTRDAALRNEWFTMAEQMLDKLEQADLSTTARRRLGSYTQQNYATWQKQAAQGELGVTIDELTNDTNQKFYRLFPQERGKKLKLTTMGQIWYAIAADRVNMRE